MWGSRFQLDPCTSHRSNGTNDSDHCQNIQLKDFPRIIKITLLTTARSGRINSSTCEIVIKHSWSSAKFFFYLFSCHHFFCFWKKIFFFLQKFAEWKLFFTHMKHHAEHERNKRRIRGNRVLLQYLIANVDPVHKCCFFLSNLQKDYELKIYVLSLCFFVPSTNSRDQRHGSGKAAQKKTAFATLHKTIWFESERWWEKLWDTFSLPFNNLN